MSILGKVSGSAGPAATGPLRNAPSSGGGGFSLGEAAGATEPAQVSAHAGVSGVGSLDALLALQQVEGPLERRRRAVRRAGRILDALEDIKLALLDGDLPAHTISRLIGAVREQRGESDDPVLGALLADIETRAAVELAKLEKRQAG